MYKIIKNMGIKKLVCFDFDDTLCNTVKHDDGKIIWREKFGTEYPHRGWWSKEESLIEKKLKFYSKVTDWMHKRGQLILF